MRRTPAGIAVLRFRVAHTGAQNEAGRQRVVTLETELIAFGAVAEALAQQAQGSELRFAGFIDRKDAQGRQIELHITEFGTIEE